MTDSIVENKHKDHEMMIDEFHCAIHEMFGRINTRVKSGVGISISEMSCLVDMLKDLSESLCCLSKFSYYDDKTVHHEKSEEKDEAVL